jgi:hypothetical protein
MYVALPYQRQPSQLLASNFAAVEKLEKRKIRFAPVLESVKSGVFVLNRPTTRYLRWAVCMIGVCNVLTHPIMTTRTEE